MSAGRGALLRVVHRGIDADFGEHFGGWRGNRVADGEVNRGQGLNHTARAVGGGNAGAVDDARRWNLAGALAIEEIAGIDAIEKEAVRSVALPVGPDGGITETADRASAAGKFRIDAGREDGHTRE